MQDSAATSGVPRRRRADCRDILPPVKVRRGIAGFTYRHPRIAIGGIVLLLLILIAIFAPLLGTVDPQAHRTCPAQRASRPPSYWFGTDMLGPRHLLARALRRARLADRRLLGGASWPRSSGLAIGLVSGFVRWVDGIIMRIMDGLMSIPPILLAIALMALTRGSVENVILAITIAEIPRVSRLVRSVVLSLREQPYVEAAIAAGTRTPLHHPAPHPAQHDRAADRAGDLHLRLAP